MTLRFLLLASLLISAGCLRAVEGEPEPFPNMAVQVGQIIAGEYYDDDRIRPELMLREALRSLESSDIAIDARWEPPRLDLVIGTDLTTIAAPVPSDLAATMVILDQVIAALDHPRFDAREQRNLAYSLLNGALQTLDPHSVIYPPEPAEQFAEDIQGEFFGIGAYLVEEDGLISIERVMPGLPAAEHGVEDGDVILGVDGEKTTGLSIGQTVRRIKGPKGSTVVLTIERAGEPEPIEIAVVRDRVRIITMRSFRHGDIGYVLMNEFNHQTAAMLFRELQILQREGPLAGFVLDLRYNTGGLLEQAQLISNFFLGKEQEIVRTVSPREEGRPIRADTRRFLDTPMLVLTSSGSASAAEILAGALQINGRAAVVGTETFGKGSVQTLFELPDGSSLKLTIQGWELAGGVSIQERGVEPDVQLLRHTVREDGAIDLVPYTLHREGDNEFALADQGTYEHQHVHHLGYLAEYETIDQRREHLVSNPDFTPDQEAQMMLELFAEAAALMDPGKVASAREAGRLREVVLDALGAPIAVRHEVEARKLAERLAERHGMTWGDDRAVTADAISGRYLGPEMVTPGETATLRFALANSGEEAAGRLYGVVRADPASPFWESEVLFGEVPAGGEITGELAFDVPPRLYPGQERFELVIRQGGRPHEDLAVIPVAVEVEQRPRPSFSYRWELLEGAAPDARLDLDETVQVRVHLRNTGDGTSAPITAYVFKDDDHYVQLGEARFTLAPLAPGAEATFDIPVTVLASVTVGETTRAFAGDSVKLQFRAEEDFPEGTDARYRASLFHTVDLPIAADIAGGRVRQPTLSLKEVERLPDQRLRLTVAVEDDNLDMIATFRGDDKIDLTPARAIGDGTYVTEVDLLAEEVTGIRIAAEDEDEVLEVMSLRMWRDVSERALAEHAERDDEPQL